MEKTKKCKCGFCQDELKNSCFEPEFCKPCSVEFVKCPDCLIMYEKHIQKCPQCASLNPNLKSKTDEK